LQFPDYIPKEYLKYFIRGFLDSDGYICMSHGKAMKHSQKIGLCTNSKKFLEKMRDIINREINIYTPQISKNNSNNCYHLIYSTNKGKALGNWLYSDILENNPQTFYLPYKFERFKEYFNII